jgi:hypothetical protein
MGLVLALFVVGVAAVLLGGIATGALSVSLGGPAWLAIAFPLLPGSYYALRVTVADTLALALAIAAVALAVRSRWRWAVPVAVLAVLTKEPMVLIFAGWWLGHRSRRAALLVVAPGVVAVTWAVALRLTVPTGASNPPELALPPLRGLYVAVTDRWFSDHEWLGMASAVPAIVLGLVVLTRRRRTDPLWWAVATQVAFASVYSANVMGMNFGATRSMQPMLLLAVLALFTSRPAGPAGQPDLVLSAPSPLPSPSSSQGSAGRDGPGSADGGSSNR